MNICYFPEELCCGETGGKILHAAKLWRLLLGCGGGRSYGCSKESKGKNKRALFSVRESPAGPRGTRAESWAVQHVQTWSGKCCQQGSSRWC